MLRARKLLVLGLLGLAIVATGIFGMVGSDANADHRHQRRHLVFGMRGVAEGEMQEIETPDGIVEANCFEVILYDLETDRVIGHATNCVYNLQFDECGNASVTEHNIFRFFGRGTLTVNATGTLAAVTTDPELTPVTHVTGAIPFPDDNNIVSGTRAFRHARGSVRLSGGINLMMIQENIVNLDCLFVIKFHRED